MADIALINGNIITMNPAQPRAEALIIIKDRIAKVGRDTEIIKLANKTATILDLNGKAVVPGFIDTHIHVADFGRTLQWIDLKLADCILVLQSQVREKAIRTAKGKWIFGSRWNHERFKEKRLPTRQDLDVVSPDNPVILFHEFGRTCLTNSTGLKLAGITRTTAPPKEGVIEKNSETGEPTGILEGNATDLVWNAIPKPTEQEVLEAAKEACAKIVEAGITSVHWIALSETEVTIARKLVAGNEVSLRVFLVSTDEIYENLSSKDQNDLKVDGVLVFSDGYLASQTAALNQSYVGDPGNHGKLCHTQDELDRFVAKIHKANLQVIIHAMGDKAVDAALKALQSISGSLTFNRKPFRLEQAALLNRQLINRIKKLSPIVSVQPKVVESEFTNWSAIEHLGETRARMLFPLKTLLKNGITVVGGSDCPMEPLSPILAIRALITRKPFQEERLTMEEALRLYTVDAAWATHEEEEKGAISEGKLADVVVLSADPTKVSSERLADIVVDMTIIGGKVAYRKTPV